MKFKRMLSILIMLIFATVSIVTVNYVNEAKAAPKITLKIGYGSSLDKSAGGKGLQKFKEIVEKESKGRITVRIFPDGQVGNDKSMMEALRMGTLDMTLPSTAPIANFSKKFMVFDLPYLFPNEEVAYKVLDGPIGQEILKDLEKIGIIGLAYWENGFRDITNSKRPIKTINDLKGLKIRVMQNPVHVETFKAWGANPTPMAFNEVFTALEQKVIDGQENPVTLIYDAGFYEVQKYLTISHHFYTAYVLMISKKTWDKLSPLDRKIITKAATIARDYERQVSRELSQKYLEEIKKSGKVQINVLPESTKKILQAKAQSVYRKFENEIGRDLLKKVLEEVKKYQKK